MITNYTTGPLMRRFEASGGIAVPAGVWIYIVRRGGAEGHNRLGRGFRRLPTIQNVADIRIKDVVDPSFAVEKYDFLYIESA